MAARPQGCTPLEKRLLKLAGARHRTRVKRAVAVMYRAHAGQTRKEGTPYATHPLAVALIAVEEVRLRGGNAIIAALLHDTLEDDMQTTPEQIRRAFGVAAARAVVSLTKMYKRDGSPKQEGLHRYYAGLRAAPEWVKAIKLCDRLHNMRSLAASNPTPGRVVEYAGETRRELLPLARGTKHGGLARVAKLLADELGRRS